MSVNTVEAKFREQLAELKSSNKKSVRLTKDEYYDLIQEVKDAAACRVKTKTLDSITF